MPQGRAGEGAVVEMGEGLPFVPTTVMLEDVDMHSCASGGSFFFFFLNEKGLLQDHAKKQVALDPPHP